MKFDSDEILPVRYVVPDFTDESGLWVQCMWSYKFGIFIDEGQPVVEWFSDADI